jgi:predicted dithiol-disulfide oxidoreductase (DUF899 family)
MEKPRIVSAEEWQRARDELLRAEEEATRVQDALAARRRRLPMVKFSNGYLFGSPDGKKTLLDLFGDQVQLAVCQFMDLGPGAYCPGCTCPACRWPRSRRTRRSEDGSCRSCPRTARRSRPTVAPAKASC